MVYVTDPDDLFDQLDTAEPVTDDQTDSVQSSVEQTEADEVRSSAQTDFDRDVSERSRRRCLSSKYVARCRFCRYKFKEHRLAQRHEGRCDVEPTAACRHCGETHTKRDDPEQHLKSCEPYNRSEQKRKREEQAAASQNETSGLDESDDKNTFSRRFIEPQPHEFHAYLKWHCGHLENPLRTYFGLRSLQGEHDFEKYGRLRTTTNIDDNEWAVEFGFKSSGLAPRDSDSFRLNEVREYLVYVYPAAYASWDDAKSEARKRAYFRISPRWPDIQTKEGLRTMSNPCDIEGYDVEVEGSNWAFDQYPVVFQQALSALADRQGFRFNSPTPIHPDDFATERIHRSSNIVDAELYVRVKKGKTGKVIAYDGTLHRISLLLAGDREGYAKSIRDDRECPGHYHTATIDSDRATELIGNHQLAKEFKHYYMRKPDAVEGTVFENPKVGVSLQNSIHDRTLHWDDLDTLTTELDEALLNVLEWSDLPTRPDRNVYVADDYFTVTGCPRWRKFLPDSLPRIEQKQDSQVFATATQMTQTDAQLVETLLTNGGATSPKKLAETIGVHLDTVYRALKRLGPLVDHTYGDVQLGSKYIAQELTGYIDGVTESIQSGLENALDGLTRAESHGGEESPWSRWLDRYGGKIRRTEGPDPDELDIGFQPASLEAARRLFREGAFQWSKVTGEPKRRFGFAYKPAITTVDGKRYAPDHFVNALGPPG